MIGFRPMNAEDFRDFLAYFIPDYAADIAANYGRTKADALARAKQQTAEDFPDGVETMGNVLLCILQSNTKKTVGYLWYRTFEKPRTAFIYDFHIFPDQQNKGLGKQALKLLETELATQGFEKIQLRVAADNPGAKHVYDVSGFRVTGINMSKNIS